MFLYIFLVVYTDALGLSINMILEVS